MLFNMQRIIINKGTILEFLRSVKNVRDLDKITTHSYHSNMKKSTVIILIIAIISLTGSLIYKYSKPQTEQNPNQSTIDKNIERLESEQSKNPSSKTAITLSSLYLQKVRETADISYYQKVDSLMESSLKSDSNNAEIYGVQSSVALGRHNFKLGLELANKAITLNPSRAFYYGLATDAHIELGQYNEAVESVQKMIDTRPDLASYSRVAYVRELFGKIDGENGAKKALSEAIEAGSNFQENIAWNYVELAKLNIRTNLSEAIKNIEASQQINKDYPPALDELAKILYFQNKIDEAKAKAEQAVSLLPIAQYATTLGDIYQSEGNIQKANQQYALAKIAYEKSTKSGVNTDQEFALFLTERNLETDKALTKAQNAFKERPSNTSGAILAWALLKNNKVEEAIKQIDQALEPVGKNDAMISFIAGSIYAQKGDNKKAKQFLETSQKINPNFSILHKKTLEELLKTLN
jgi:tetratricopeptide (TPR) repeat protein